MNPEPDYIDPEQFRERVLAHLREEFPELAVEAPPTEWDLLIVPPVQLGLANMRARFESSDQTEETLRTLVREHVAILQENQGEWPDFESVRERLRPQLMPESHTQEAPLIAFPFAGDLFIGIVIDAANSYTYVTEQHAETWEKGSRELLEVALSNLDVASRGMNLHFSGHDAVKILIAQQADGFDAARILLPDLRKLAGERLGLPYHFAVPNRDFLIMWSADAPDEIMEALSAQVATDAVNQPYPLTPSLFLVEEDGAIVELIPDEEEEFDGEEEDGDDDDEDAELEFGEDFELEDDEVEADDAEEEEDDDPSSPGDYQRP